MIVEGEKYGIASVRFAGNEAFTDSQLRKVIETKWDPANPKVVERAKKLLALQK